MLAPRHPPRAFSEPRRQLITQEIYRNIVIFLDLYGQSFDSMQVSLSGLQIKLLYQNGCRIFTRKATKVDLPK